MIPVLWGRASSVNVQKVMWLLAELGLAHTRKDAGGRYGETDTPAFAALNPTRRVPVWEGAEGVVWESHAILRHLGAGPAAAFWPEEGIARAQADQWMEFTTNTLLPAFIGVFWQKVRLPVAERSERRLATHLSQLEAALDVLEGQLDGRQWLVGDAPTLADVAAGTPMYRIYDMDLNLSGRPALAAWYQRLTARPAYQSTVMTDYEELRGA